MELKEIKTPLEWMKLWKLYMQAFPECERKPLRLVWKVRKQGKTDVWIIEQEGKFAGFAIVMKDADLVLLDYLAVCDNKRGGGLGSRTLQKLWEKYPGKRFFLEIENVYVPAENLDERKRRKRFLGRFSGICQQCS